MRYKLDYELRVGLKVTTFAFLINRKLWNFHHYLNIEWLRGIQLTAESSTKTLVKKWHVLNLILKNGPKF